MTLEAHARIRTRPAPDCYLCGRPGEPLFGPVHDRLFHAPGEWSVRQCAAPDCGLAWMDPQPEPADIGKLYESYNTHRPDPSPTSPRARLEQAIVKATLGYPKGESGRGARTAGRLLGQVPLLRDIAQGRALWLPDEWRGRLLDIGCGNGGLIQRLARLGWEVHGIDADAQAVAVARDQLGLDARVGSIETAGFPDASFDVITMSHVIEHVPDPIVTMAACLRALRPGGRLVLVTPNRDSWACRLFGSHWVHWDPPRHLFLFSARTLGACAEKAGFRVESVRWSARVAGAAWAASNVIRKDGELPDFALREHASRTDLLGGVLFQAAEQVAGRRGGEEVVLVAVRP